MQTWVDLKFADGEYTFKLGLAQIAEIERRCDAGIGAVYARIARGRYGFDKLDAMPDQAEFRLSELVEVVRQALIGGASGIVDGENVRVTPTRANELVERYVLAPTDHRVALADAWALAFAVLHALVHGYDPDPKAEPGSDPATPTSGST